MSKRTSVKHADQFEFLTLNGKRRPKLSEEERAELFKRWEQKRYTADDEGLLRADFERALLKNREHPEHAPKVSASVTCLSIFAFKAILASYARESRGARQKGGQQSGGVVESSTRPSTDQVVQAIQRVTASGAPKREIVRRVQEGGINLTRRQIRNVGQQQGLLPKRGLKGKR